MKFIVELPRARQQEVVDGESLFTLLENEQMLAHDDTDLLEEMLSQIHRQDLQDKLHTYNSMCHIYLFRLMSVSEIMTIIVHITYI